MYRVTFTKAARKQLLHAPAHIAAAIRERLAQIAQDPHPARTDVRPMKGRPGFRLRIGGWRVLYKLEDDRLIIIVVKIGPRGDVYK